jgi:hypothetical protein
MESRERTQMAPHQLVVEEPEAPMVIQFVLLSTSETFGFTAGNDLRVIIRLNQSGTRVVTFLPLLGAPFILFGASRKGIVSG